MMPAPNLSNLPRRLLYDVVQLFIVEGKSAPQVFEYLRENYPWEVDEFAITRLKIYSIAHVACRKGILGANPLIPKEDLRELVGILKGRIGDGKKIEVVDASRYSANAQVTQRAAQVLWDLIEQRHQAAPERRIILGVGGGLTVQMVMETLGAILKFAPRNLKLRCQSLIPGFSPHELDTPASYSRFFQEAREERGLDIDFFGVSAAPFVWDEDLREQREHDPFMQEAFENALNLDLVITGLASAANNHQHGMLARTFNNYRSHPALADLERHLKAHHWLGDVHYCPFNPEGPIPLEGQWRPMSLVTIDDLKTLVGRGTEVVLCSGFCNESTCNETRSAALYPLVRKPALKGCWTHIVTESQTARELKTLIDGEP